MKFDHPIYLIVTHHRDGPYIPETDIDCTDLVTLTKELREGQYSDVAAILECIVKDVTHDFKDVIPDPDRRPDDT